MTLRSIDFCTVSAWSCALLSLGLLYPGLVQPSISLNVQFGSISLLQETRSIVGLIQSLYQDNKYLVASMILTFSVVIPVLKILTTLAILITRNLHRKRLGYQCMQIIGKWSMADVFIVAVFVTFLSANANSHMSAVLEPGFWWFAGYCMVSLLALHFVRWPPAHEQVKSADLSTNRRTLHG